MPDGVRCLSGCAFDSSQITVLQKRFSADTGKGKAWARLGLHDLLSLHPTRALDCLLDEIHVNSFAGRVGSDPK